MKEIANCLGHVGCIAHGIHLLLTTDIFKADTAEQILEVLRKVKQIHEKLAFKNPEVEQLSDGDYKKVKEYLRQWDEELMEIAEASENIHYTSDYIKIEPSFPEQIAKVGEEHFPKPNVTRWMTSFAMLKSYKDNEGKFDYCSCDSVNKLIYYRRNYKAFERN